MAGRARRDRPGWCPAWGTTWQRCYRLVHNRLQADGTLPTAAGTVVVQGEDLGRWVTAQRHRWERLLLAQQWLLENTLGLAPAGRDERPVKRTRDGKWAANLEAARQFHTREGHLRVPHEHVERLEAVVVKLGTWLDNVRKRVAKLAEQRRADLDALGIPW